MRRFVGTRSCIRILIGPVHVLEWPALPGAYLVSSAFQILRQPPETCCVGKDENLARRPRRWSRDAEPRRDEPSPRRGR
jgi:hypothetical protein